MILDFNRATNLPCAYTQFATCPLPPAENRLPVAVEAGEQIPGEATQASKDATAAAAAANREVLTRYATDGGRISPTPTVG